MHHFILELGQMRINAVKTFKKRAENVYDENLSAYVKLVLRRPFARIIVSVSIISPSKISTVCFFRTILKAWTEP